MRIPCIFEDASIPCDLRLSQSQLVCDTDTLSFIYSDCLALPFFFFAQTGLGNARARIACFYIYEVLFLFYKKMAACATLRHLPPHPTLDEFLWPPGTEAERAEAIQKVKADRLQLSVRIAEFKELMLKESSVEIRSDVYTDLLADIIIFMFEEGRLSACKMLRDQCPAYSNSNLSQIIPLPPYGKSDVYSRHYNHLLNCLQYFYTRFLREWLVRELGLPSATNVGTQEQTLYDSIISVCIPRVCEAIGTREFAVYQFNQIEQRVRDVVRLRKDNKADPFTRRMAKKYFLKQLEGVGQHHFSPLQNPPTAENYVDGLTLFDYRLKGGYDDSDLADRDMYAALETQAMDSVQRNVETLDSQCSELDFVRRACTGPNVTPTADQRPMATARRSIRMSSPPDPRTFRLDNLQQARASYSAARERLIDATTALQNRGDFMLKKDVQKLEENVRIAQRDLDKFETQCITAYTQQNVGSVNLVVC